MSEPHSRLGPTAIALHVATLAGVFAALAAWTWGTWPDVLVDFGRELYVPWQLVEGKRLYADLAYFNGPLSPQWNALVFRIFGVGLSTLVWTNLTLFAALIALLHYVLRSISTPLAATAACIVVMCTCGFGQLVGIGNYNYVCPYSHEATHGMLLGIAALAAVQRGRGGVAWTLLAGVCVGLAFLTKPEMFVAAFAGSGAAVWLHARTAKVSVARPMLAWLLGLLAPIAVAWLWLPSDVAATGVLGAWPSLFTSDVADLRFYRAGMGIDEPGLNALKMLAWTFGALGMLVPSMLVARIVTARTSAKLGAPIAFVLTLAAIAALYSRVPWLQTPRSWPLFALTGLVLAFRRWRRDGDPRAASGAAFALFSLAMLAKMVLDARLMNYGFALAMPATALIVLMAEWLPRQLAKLRIDGPTTSAGVAAVLLGFCAIHIAITSNAIGRKQEIVGSGADAFRADERGRFVATALRWLAEGFPTQRPTLAVLPEGVTINYLARLVNPTPYVNFMPPELVLFGEPNIVAAFDAHPPDVVLLVHKSTAEYGVPFFGRDYGQAFGRWLQEHYRPATDRSGQALLLGDPPLQPGSRFGMAVLVRK
jgi:hypothetical protein